MLADHHTIFAHIFCLQTQSKTSTPTYEHTNNIGLRMSKKHACIIAWWAKQAGAAGSELEELSVHPDAQSGKYAVSFDAYTGITRNDDRLYELALPGQRPTADNQ